MTAARAAFVDRDGVINELIPDGASGRPESPLREQDVVLIPGAASGLMRFVTAGWLLVGVSNQPAAAKAAVTVEDLEAVHARVIDLLAEEGVRFDAFRLCLHHPDGVVPELRVNCDCRKPSPGMLRDAAQELDIDLRRSWMIGDTDGDVLAGRAAGCRTALVHHAASAHKRVLRVRADAVAPDLAAAAALILSAPSVQLSRQ